MTSANALAMSAGQQQQKDSRTPFSYNPPYASPRQSESVVLLQHTEQGLDVYDSSMPTETNASIAASAVPAVWSRQDYLDLVSSGPPPDIFSAAFDPFATLESNNQFLYPEARTSSTVPELSSSPTPSVSRSCRSSISRSPSESFSLQAPPEAFAPKVKMEDGQDYYMPDASMLSGAGPEVYLYSTSGDVQPVATYGSVPNQSYPPSEYGYQISERSSYEDLESGETSPGKITNAERTRSKAKRNATTRENANHECHICGKLFARSYNYKAHMETHDPTREHPHVCMVKNCGKKFVRKTDLLRHHSSVHEKQRNYQCHLCGNLFARKDTLRRHTEDGCSKRFEIATTGYVPSTEPAYPTTQPAYPATQPYGNTAYGVSSPLMQPSLYASRGVLPQQQQQQMSPLPPPSSSAAPSGVLPSISQVYPNYNPRPY